jgi:hypothetical protein
MIAAFPFGLSHLFHIDLVSAEVLFEESVFLVLANQSAVKAQP